MTYAGPPRAGSGPGEKKIINKKLIRYPSKYGPAKYLSSKSEGLAVICSVTWTWSDRYNLDTRQIMIAPRKTTTYAT